jgi:class 3 adenylate cyclase
VAASTHPAEHPIDAFMSAARARGERWISGARIAVCVLVAARMALVKAPRVTGGDVLDWLPITILLLGALFSGLVVRLSASRHHALAATLSVVLDAVLVLGGECRNVLRPLSDFNGMLRAPELAIFVIVIMCSVLRFSVRLTLLAAVLNTAVLILLLAIDRVPRTPYPAWIWANAITYLAAAILIAYAATRRGLRLIADGAKALLAAERVRQRFGAYVSAEIADAAISSEQLSLGGERHEVAVLFSDLRGFTKYAEHLPPEKLVTELNSYIDAMLPEIHKEGGVVDKYIGDSIMVVFGIPRPGTDDAARAIRAARGMQRALRKHNRDRHGLALPPLVQGIGVHFGPVVAGHIGTRERLQFTVIGDVVNLASRLESATKDHNVAVLISRAAVDAAARTGQPLPQLRTLGEIHLRGRGDPLEALCLPDDGSSQEIALDPISAKHAPIPTKETA